MWRLLLAIMREYNAYHREGYLTIFRFLRWSALQECAFVDPYDGLMRVWSESHVSEDFQIALNVQTQVSSSSR